MPARDIGTTRHTHANGRPRLVRKNMIVDQRKLDEARRALGAATETDTVDQALDLVAFRTELSRGIAAM